VFEVLERIASTLPGYEGYMDSLRALFDDLLHIYTITPEGDVVLVYGKLDSGKFGTTDENNLCMEFAWRLVMLSLDYMIEPEEFHHKVILDCYGDDNQSKFCDDVMQLASPTQIVERFSEFGFKMTMSRKQGEIRFVNQSELLFLKRGVWFEELEGDLPGIWKAPLEHASIEKALCFYTSECPLTKVEYITAAVENAQMQYWMHGREVFEERQQFLKNIMAELCGIGSPYATDVIKWYAYDDVTALYLKREYRDWLA
jgi:hypothetical protein